MKEPRVTRTRLRGVMAALPTPFLRGRVDLAAYGALVEHLIGGGVDGLVVSGTTGEGATLTAEERDALVRRTVDLAAGRAAVVAGVGTHATRTTVEAARRAEDLGVDGLLVVTPYYNRPSQEGLELHFGTVAEAVEASIVLYNVPKRTGVDLEPKTAARLADRHANVVAIKEAHAIPQRWRDHADLGALDLLCGEDSGLVEARRAGAVGWIGVVPNLDPEGCVALYRASAPAPEGDAGALTAGLARVAPLMAALELDGNPAAVKTALSLQGRMAPDLRAPLVAPGPAVRQAIAAELARHRAPETAHHPAHR